MTTTRMMKREPLSRGISRGARAFNPLFPDATSECRRRTDKVPLIPSTRIKAPFILHSYVHVCLQSFPHNSKRVSLLRSMAIFSMPVHDIWAELAIWSLAFPVCLPPWPEPPRCFHTQELAAFLRVLKTFFVFSICVLASGYREGNTTRTLKRFLDKTGACNVFSMKSRNSTPWGSTWIEKKCWRLKASAIFCD